MGGMASTCHSGERCYTGEGLQMKTVNVWVLQKMFSFTGVLSAQGVKMYERSDKLCETIERMRLRAGIPMEDIAPLS
jgi:hypothetical protein